MTPSRVSQTIRTLERRVGGRLFERTSRAVSLTALGAQMRQSMLPAYQQMEQAFNNARAAATGLTGTVRIGMYSPANGGPYPLEIIAGSSRSTRTTTSSSWRPDSSTASSTAAARPRRHARRAPSHLRARRRRRAGAWPGRALDHDRPGNRRRATRRLLAGGTQPSVKADPSARLRDRLTRSPGGRRERPWPRTSANLVRCAG
nr:LysR family transcriptional regulator [Desertimonas flava]